MNINQLIACFTQLRHRSNAAINEGATSAVTFYGSFE